MAAESLVARAFGLSHAAQRARAAYEDATAQLAGAAAAETYAEEVTQQIALLLRALDGFRLPLHALPEAAQAPVYTTMRALARAVESALEPAVLAPLRALSATASQPQAQAQLLTAHTTAAAPSAPQMTATLGVRAAFGRKVVASEASDAPPASAPSGRPRRVTGELTARSRSFMTLRQYGRAHITAAATGA